MATIAGKLIKGAGSVLGTTLTKIVPSATKDIPIVGGLVSTVSSTVGKLFGGGKKKEYVPNPVTVRKISDLITNKLPKLASIVKERQSIKKDVIPNDFQSPNVDQFSEPRTGLQREIFGNPPSNSYTVSPAVGFKTDAVPDYDVNLGEYGQVSSGKKMPIVAWVSIGVGAFVALVLLIGSMFKRKR